MVNYTTISNTTTNPNVWPSDTLIYNLGYRRQSMYEYDSVTVNAQLPVADAGGDRWLCPGDSIILFGTGGINYNWSPDSTLISENTANPIAFPLTNQSLVLQVEDQTIVFLRFN